MTNEMIAESPIDSKWDFWKKLRKPTVKDLQRFNRARMADLKKVWPWIRRFMILALVVGVGALLYQYGVTLLWGINQFLGGVFRLLGTLVQLVWSVIVFCFLCSGAALMNIFGFSDESLKVTFDSWLFAGIPPYDWDNFDWGTWELGGAWVNLIGLPTALLSSIAVHRLAQSFWEQAVEKRIAPIRTELRSQINTLTRNLESEPKVSFAAGQREGVAAEQAIVRRALIHAYTPKMSLPTLEEGKTRIFWIEVTIKVAEVRPTDKRRIRWSDVPAVPLFILGAPVYDKVNSKGPDRLTMMSVVYTLDENPTCFA